MSQPLFTTNRNIILASASPRRQSFLHELGLQFTTKPADIDETPEPEESAEDFVRRMAAGKAESIASLHPDAVVIGADTVISHHGEILGKPTSPAEALTILQKLQGTNHIVMTALGLYCREDNLAATLVGATTVTFGRFPKEVLDAYIRSGEPMDKAGAYAIQGIAAQFVKNINGSFSGVMGLPLYETVALLKQCGVSAFDKQNKSDEQPATPSAIRQ